MVVANRAIALWQRKTKESERKKKQQKQQAEERGEETDSEDDEDDDDEVVADVEWDVLEGEDMLIGTHSSMQGPFPFHVGGSESVRSAETGQTIGPSSGPVGADGSTAVLGVLVEGGGSTAAPHKLIGAGGSAAMPGVPVEGAAPLPHPMS